MNARECPPRKDGYDKVRGRARYVADLGRADVLHACTIRTRRPGGRVAAVHWGPEVAWAEYVVVTADDIPGRNCVQMITDDQPALVKDRFRHAGEPVVLLAHPDRRALAQAAAAVRIEEEPGAGPVFDIDAALDRAADGTVFQEYELRKGDAANAAAEIEWRGTYVTGAQEHLYIEPQGMVACYQDGTLIIEGSLQCPYYVQAAVAVATGLPAGSVRIRPCATGGAFGGKEEYPSHSAIHAALLALKTPGRSVSLIYDRAEDMAVTPKRHPSRSIVRLGADRHGRLRFMDIDFVIDGGAYVTLSPVVLSRGVIHAAGPYRCPHVRVRGRAVATNHPPFGAFRGFGAPQSIFALECAMDDLARHLGVSPVELRARNLLGDGDVSPAGQRVEGIDMPGILRRALAHSAYDERQKACRAWNAREKRSRRGLGIATFYHGAGFTGNGERHLASRAGLRVRAEGTVEILCSNTEMGQGMQTTLAQIVADALAIPYDWVQVAVADTGDVPNSGPTVASRTCMVVGRILEQAAADVLERLRAQGGLPVPHDPQAFAQACARFHAACGPLVCMSEYVAPASAWNEATFQGAPYGSFAWACYVAEVEVDLVTYAVTVRDFFALQEVGRIVHPVVAAGQIEGGIAQGIGFALTEKVVFGADGVMANNRVTNYILPTSADLPPIRVVFEQNGQGAGPRGATGIGELPMDGPAPAIVNAINAALGIALSGVPVLPEDVMAAIEGAKGGRHAIAL